MSIYHYTALLSLFCCTLCASDFEWQQPQATISETGDLEWAPTAFELKLSESVRYIDFDGGNDEQDGRTPNSAWKHHPWDAQAQGLAASTAGNHSYVFKRGVLYRGTLIANESGSADKPIRLTSDPHWGTGLASIAGSTQLTTNWQPCTKEMSTGIPHPEQVWHQQLAGASPWCVWWKNDDGEIIRLALAREPDWTVSDKDDPRSEWKTWYKEEDWKSCEWVHDIKQDKKAPSLLRAYDVNGLTETDPSIHVGATVWTEWLGDQYWVMNTPFASRVESYEPENNALLFNSGFWTPTTRTNVKQHCRYYLENRPAYLDQDGEFYFDSKNKTLYIRMPEGRDPNTCTVEVAQRLAFIEIHNQSHIDISGLNFCFANVYDPAIISWKHPDTRCAAIRGFGAAENINVHHNTFHHINKAVLLTSNTPTDILTNIRITDNNISHTDHGAIKFAHSPNKKEDTNGELGQITILRNQLHDIGQRPIRGTHSHAIFVEAGTRTHIAGNIITKCYGAGIFARSGKPSGTHNKPLVRCLIHHNKVVDALLHCNDYGSIESWWGGPTYVWSNISGNPGGYRHTLFINSKDKPANEHDGSQSRWGPAYYLDHQYKGYLFNNIAWGNNNTLTDKACNTTALLEAHGFLNAWFQNTSYNFASGSRRGPGPLRSYLGNLWLDMSHSFLLHGKPVVRAGVTTDGNYSYNSTAYAGNVFHGTPRMMGKFEHTDQVYDTFEEFDTALKKRRLRADSLGSISQENPVRNAAKHDFRLTETSAARDHGTKVFVPWGLYDVVGEWHFNAHPQNPSIVLDEHFTLGRDHIITKAFSQIPRYDWHISGITAADYQDGILEDWTKGALTLNNASVGVISDAPTRQDLNITNRKKTHHIPAAHRHTLDISTHNMLIEMVIRIDEKCTDSPILSKYTNGSGYQLSINTAGQLHCQLSNTTTSGSSTSSTSFNDGQWHHILIDVDRNKHIVFYGDGKLAPSTTTGTLPTTTQSISNTAEVILGGNGFTGSLDFLRVARGSLADAHTSIDELYNWQFNGPAQRDFTGALITDGKRDAGAFEYP